MSFAPTVAGRAASLTAAALAATTTLGLAASAAASTPYELRVIAATGDAAPGTIAGSFTGFGHPQMNAVGQIAFMGVTDSALGATGLWTRDADDPQSIAMLAGQGWPVPGAAGFHYGPFDASFYHPLIAADGDVGFAAPLVEDEGDDPFTAVLRQVDGTTEMVLRPGDQAPGQPAGVVVEFVGNLITANAEGLLGIKGVLAGPGVTEANDSIMFHHWFGGLQTVLREGQAAPGMPGTTWTPTSFFAPQMDDTGRLLIDARLEGDFTASWSIWTGYPGLYDLQTYQGDVAPNGETLASPGTLVNTFLGGDGTVSYMAVADDGDTWPRMIGRVRDGSHEVIAAEGDAGPLGTYTNLTSYALQTGPDGSTLFAAILDADESSNTGILLAEPDGSMRIVTYEGMPAPGFAAGIEVGDISIYTGAMTMDAEQRVFVQGIVRGPGIDADNDQAVWVFDADGTGHLVIREGAEIVVRGANQIVDAVQFTEGLGVQSGRRSPIGDRGDLALKIVLADGTQAIVHAYPQPTATCAADVNEDGVVDFADILVVLASWDQPGPVGTGGDTDWDGDTDFVDLLEVLAWYGHVCGS